MSDSPDPLWSEKSASRTSINIKLPSATTRDRDEKSPDPGSSTHGKQTPVDSITPRSIDGKLLESPDNKEFIGQQLVPTPSSLKTLISSPVRSLRNGPNNQRELIRQAAASIIEKAWIAFRDRQMFCLLKHSVCAAESSLSLEILRKVTPKEADFFKDKSLQIKVRFRFGGSEFPPMIYFKIFYNSEGKRIKYMSGKKMIKPASEAAEDSLRLMGNRLFYEQLLQDSVVRKRYAITDEVDVTTLKDYMQYLANLDETPAYMGGKENYWRKLTLDVLPRHTIFYDVVDYAYNRVLSPRLNEEFSLLTSRPVTQEIQLQQLNSIGQLRSPVAPAVTPRTALSSEQNPQVSGRRSKRARIRAIKMRRMMGLDKELTDVTNSNTLDVDDWEHEASKLYEWTQELSFNDDAMATPRLMQT